MTGWDGRHPNCVCAKSMGDTQECAMHADVWEQRQAGCSCWAGGAESHSHLLAAVQETQNPLDRDQ